jgi:uncharacterized protein YjbJ (UPF0337 family)
VGTGGPGRRRGPRQEDIMASGRVDKTKGRIKKAIGDLTDDPDLKRRGQVDETAGKIKDGVERGVDRARDAIKGKRP